MGIPRVPGAAKPGQGVQHGMPPRAAAWDRACWGLALPGWEQQPAPPQAARAGSPRGAGRADSGKEGLNSSTQRGRRLIWDGVGSLRCGELRPMSAGSDHHSPTSPAGEEQLPLVETPPRTPLLGYGPHGERGRAPHQNQPRSCQGAQALHCPEARHWGVLGTWGPMGHSRCWPTWLCGKHITPEKPNSSPWWRCGDRVAELLQAAWLSPSQPFLHLVLKRAGVQPDPHPGNASGMQEQCSFADKVITRSPSWKLELIKFNLEIEATALQLPRRAKKGGGSRWRRHKSQFPKHTLSPRCWQRQHYTGRGPGLHGSHIHHGGRAQTNAPAWAPGA